MTSSVLFRPSGDGTTGSAPKGAERPSPLRILLGIPLYPPVIGGAEIHVSRLAAALARRGHAVQVLTTYAAPMPVRRRWIDPQGIPVIAIGVHLPASLRPRAYVAAVAAHLLVARPRYDMVQLFLPGLHLVAGIVGARLRGTASAIMFGSSIDVALLQGLRLGRVQLSTIRQWVDAVVVLNDEMRRDFRALGIPEERIEWLPCSVDPQTFRPPTPDARRACRQELQLAEDDFVVSFVGRFDPAKNLPALIRAMRPVTTDQRRMTLCLVGDGAERPALEQLARAEDVQGAVRFLGTRVGDEVARVLQASDAFAMVSHSEGIPCALIEAMAVGLPCVVHDLPALGQLVEHGVHGLRVAVDDHLALQRALVTLADDDSSCRRMGEAGRARALAGYGVDLVAARHEALYRRAIAWRRGDGRGLWADDPASGATS